MIRLPEGIHVPDGTKLDLDIPTPPARGWPPGYFESTAGALAGEPFERPTQFVSRPIGLCAGEFIVPADFDDPLPPDILDAFEGR